MTERPAHRFAQVDVFTATAFAGNPAGVLVLEGAVGAARFQDDAWLGLVAREVACANTAFAIPRASADGYDLRWFTGGGVEVALCGHATLATAHVLYERELVPRDQAVRFFTKGGDLSATRRRDGGLEMDFPVTPAAPVSVVPGQIRDGIGVDLVWVGRSNLDYVVEVADEATLRAIRPKLPMLAEVETRGFVVTSLAEDAARDGYDYVLRFFGPRVGVPEDMVTGTAHCALAPYWSDRFGGRRRRFTAFQASTRGGLVQVELKGDRVLIAGQAVTVLEGTLVA